MEYQDFIDSLPSNNFYRFDDIDLFLEIYSYFYPTEPEREDHYNSLDYSSSCTQPF